MAKSGKRKHGGATPININVSAGGKKQGIFSGAKWLEFAVVAGIVIVVAYFLFGIIGAALASAAAVFKKVSSVTGDVVKTTNKGFDKLFDGIDTTFDRTQKTIAKGMGHVYSWDEYVRKPANPNNIPGGPTKAYEYVDSNGVKHGAYIWRPH